MRWMQFWARDISNMSHNIEWENFSKATEEMCFSGLNEADHFLISKNFFGLTCARTKSKNLAQHLNNT